MRRKKTEFEELVLEMLQKTEHRLSSIERLLMSNASCQRPAEAAATEPRLTFTFGGELVPIDTQGHSISSPAMLQFGCPAATSGKGPAAKRHALLDRKRIEHYAKDILARTPFPSDNNFDTIIRRIKNDDSYLDNDLILSRVKEWFRKQREYMTHRINTVCNNVALEQNDGHKEWLERVMADDAECDEAFERCRLEVRHDTERRSFVRQKVKAFFENIGQKRQQHDSRDNPKDKHPLGGDDGGDNTTMEPWRR